MLQKLVTLLKKHSLDGYLIPSTDEFLGEYTPPHLARLEWLTGFGGSNGLAIITTKKNGFLTDGRYKTEAKLLFGKAYDVLDWAEVEVHKNWFFKNLNKKKVGFDPMLFSYNQFKMLNGISKNCGFTLEAVAQNLVDLLWNREKGKKGVAYFLDKKITGVESRDKIKHVCESFAADADFLLLTNPDSICWLLNMRGEDLPYCPFVLSYLLLNKNGSFELFEKHELDKAKKKFLEIIKAGKKIQFDEAKTPYWFYLNGGANNILMRKDPIELLKACKNETELKGIRLAHEEDGKAVTKFLKWLKSAKNIGEIDAANKLLEFRKKSKNFVCPSFESISAYGKSGAIIHYKPKKNNKIGKDSLYLIDSGGQYYTGTTDVTRTICLGKPTKEQIRNYTLVLKGHIALASIIFPVGTTGSQLDVLARQFLWKHGLDYKHGTGHGVGHFLSVHEGPQRIGSAHSSVPLEVGMILSNEPGYYKVGHYGIRLENLVEVVRSKHEGFLEFRTLTKVPFESKLIEKKMLSKEELSWMTEYELSC